MHFYPLISCLEPVEFQEAQEEEKQAEDDLNNHRKKGGSSDEESKLKTRHKVKKHGLEVQLAKELGEANHLLTRLRRLERIRHEILELKQSTVAEIRSYQSPPIIVHTVMTSTFLVLGHKEKETKDWKTVQALVGKTGKEGLKRRCLQCKPEDVSVPAAKRAKDLMSKFELDEIRDVSAGAATFYVWAIAMIEEVLDRASTD
ncbi:hypothetical protein KUTeg_016061 [Tegillarca granosa]|uniref:Uncharacterized protein n=1 Tax=Tegillarca granosa TaxID=220873 RepID=A0ABQ9ENN0_TEGGR|nr:hypothetical protein KUTeg_016061 [Tegillarca granosa]